MEKLREAGLVRPLVKMAGKRGQKTLYTLASSAFIILPIFSGDKERIFETLKASITVPRELVIRGTVIGLLIGVLMLFPWYFLAVSYYSKAPEAAYTTQHRNASTPNATVGPMVRGPSPNETPAAEGSCPEESLWLPIFLALGILASTLSAVTNLLLLRRYGKSMR